MSIFSHISRFFGKRNAARIRGFTLIELLMITAIMTIITLVLLLRQSTFDSSTILRSLAYSVALSVRQAQVYGVSVLGSDDSGAVQYASAYGVYFDRLTPTTYVLFADFNKNGLYDSATEGIKTYTLRAGYTISQVCAKLSNGANRCTGANDSTGTRTINNLAVLFKRPNPDATFKSDLVNETYVSVWVQIKSPAGVSRSVLVTGPGQISVQSPETLP